VIAVGTGPQGAGYQWVDLDAIGNVQTLYPERILAACERGDLGAMDVGVPGCRPRWIIPLPRLVEMLGEEKAAYAFHRSSAGLSRADADGFARTEY
jgi:hypothetical protein